VNDQQLLRYSRHILLPQLGIEGQERLLAARALLVGAGGLGSPAAMYLASAGMGTIVLCDGDTVDLTNLQRQILHHTASVTQPKAVSGRNTLALINPEVNVVALEQRLEGEALEEQVAAADVVLDCSDNFATRHAINRACVKFRKPLVSGAAIRSTARSRCSTCATRKALLQLPVSGRPGRGGSALRRDGRLRPAHRHHRHHAGGRGAQARRRLRRVALGQAAAARRPGDGMAQHPARQGPGCAVCGRHQAG